MAHDYIRHICSFLNDFSFYRAETFRIDRAIDWLSAVKISARMIILRRNNLKNEVSSLFWPGGYTKHQLASFTYFHVFFDKLARKTLLKTFYTLTRFYGPKGNSFSVKLLHFQWIFTSHDLVKFRTIFTMKRLLDCICTAHNVSR